MHSALCMPQLKNAQCSHCCPEVVCSTDLSLLIRAGDFWRVSSEVGLEGAWLKAEVVSEEDQLMRLEVVNLL